MEEDIFSEAWAWMDDDLKFETDFPLGNSHSLWEDFPSNKGVERSLFPSDAASRSKELSSSAFFSERPDSPEHKSSRNIMPKCSLSPLKRRCTSQFSDEGSINSTLNPSASILIDGDVVVGVGECSQGSAPSSTGSLCSFDGVAEQSAKSWMVGCISDSDTNYVQEIPPACSVNSSISEEASETSLARATVGVASKNRRTPRKALSGVVCSASHSKPSKHTPGQLQIKRRAHITLIESDHARDSARNVLAAYPFALVKPSGIEGDVTLHDINQRIKMVPTAPRRGSKDSYCESSGSPLSGKAVVALTKIQTEGNGIITILRTRS